MYGFCSHSEMALTAVRPTPSCSHVSRFEKHLQRPWGRTLQVPASRNLQAIPASQTALRNGRLEVNRLRNHHRLTNEIEAKRPI